MYVPLNFIMDPIEDELLLDGNPLQEGMVVLIEDDTFRVAIDRYTGQPRTRSGPDFNKKDADKFNRWTTITQLRKENDKVFFIGVYPDGQKHRFEVAIYLGWYVKKNSMPDDPLLENAFTLGYRAGKRDGLKEGVAAGKKENRNRYNQGYVDGSEGKSPDISGRNLLNPPDANVIHRMSPKEFLTSWPRRDAPVHDIPADQFSHDAKLLGKIVEIMEYKEGLKPITLIYQDDEPTNLAIPIVNPGPEFLEPEQNEK